MSTNATSTGVPVLTLGERLVIARKRGGFKSAQEMADAVGITRGALAQYEADRTEPKTRIIFAIARATGVPADWLMEGIPGVRQEDAAHTGWYSPVSFDDLGWGSPTTGWTNLLAA